MVELLPPGPQLGVFFGAVLVLALTPGPALFYILATSIAQGTSAGVISVLGIATGTLVHVVMAVFGLTLLLASSAAVFQFVKYAGAAYLVALGLYLLARPRQGQAMLLERPARDLLRVYSHAVMVNVLNPKVGIFFLAFFPQFVDPGRGEPALQFLLLGAVLIGVVLVTDTLFTFTAGVVTRLLRRQSGQSRWPQFVGGLTYIGLGVFSAAIEPPTQG